MVAPPSWRSLANSSNSLGLSDVTMPTAETQPLQSGWHATHLKCIGSLRSSRVTPAWAGLPGDVIAPGNAMQSAVAQVKVDSSLHDYALEIVSRTRHSEQLSLGVSPRGTLMLQRAAQARAFLDGRDYCLPDDFKQLAVSVFSHRVVASSRHASLQK